MIFILKLRGVCNLFPHGNIYSFFSFLSQLSLKDYFLNSLWKGWNRVSRGWNRVPLTTWVRTGYCGAHVRMAPPPSWYSVLAKHPRTTGPTVESCYATVLYTTYDNPKLSISIDWLSVYHKKYSNIQLQICKSRPGYIGRQSASMLYPL